MIVCFLWYNAAMTSILANLQNLFSRVNIEELAVYQHKQPRDIQVETSYDTQSRRYTARVAKIDSKKVSGLIVTESKTPEGLVYMVNDAILTYLDIPERIGVHLPKLLPEDIDFDTCSQKRKLVLAK